MLEYRSIPPLDEMPPEYLESGHFWLQEYVVGRVVGFEMADSGLLTFGSKGERFGSDSVPLHLRRGVETVRQNLNRDLLREGTDAVDAYTFYGVVPLWSGISYDWDSIPAFLGVDIWNDGDTQYVAEDVVERVFGSVGLETIPSFEKEVPVRSFNPRTYEVPDSQWADQQAAGVVLRKKHGNPSRIIAKSFEAVHPSSEPIDAKHKLIREWVATRLDRPAIEAIHPDTTILTNRNFQQAAVYIIRELPRREYALLSKILEQEPELLETAIRDRVRNVARSDPP